MLLSPAAACEAFLDTQDGATIAAQLRNDRDACKAGRRPGFLAVFLPHSSTKMADEISNHLINEETLRKSVDLPEQVRRMWYEGIVDGIKSYLAQMSALEYLSLETDVQRKSNLKKPSGTFGESRSDATTRRRRNALCYICRFENANPSDKYPALCQPCGSFNIAESMLSLPGSLDLTGKIAVVTGGRVNLGFCTALRLLRCGAKVIVSSRYPRDTELRYSAENDASTWRSRLRIVGADFRTASDAFKLVGLVRQQVKLWSDTGTLDILINNAAQTLTDPLLVEKKAVEQERILKHTMYSVNCMDEHYEAKMRGGMTSSWVSSLEGQDQLRIENGAFRPESYVLEEQEEDHKLQELSTKNISQTQRSQVEHAAMTSAAELSKSSWVQSMDEIPYEDVVTAHSVNFLVPLILCRELLPLMGRQTLTTDCYGSGVSPSEESESGGKISRDNDSTVHSEPSAAPLGYILNVSSREGIFEDRKRAQAKQGTHVHTNTSKAALNMITETEADTCWRKRRVAMNTIDPGYMSAAPEMQKLGRCPITFDDGAARVLWPVAVGQSENTAVHGRFLKHFGKVEVDVGVGR